MIAWNAALGEHVPSVDERTRELMATQLSNVDADWVGAGPVLALIADRQGQSPEEMFLGLAELARRSDGRTTLQQVIGDNLLDADITNWDEVLEASSASLSDPNVDVPALTYDSNQLDELGTWLIAAFESGGDSLYIYGPGRASHTIRWCTTARSPRNTTPSSTGRRENPDQPVPAHIQEAFDAYGEAAIFNDSAVTDVDYLDVNRELAPGDPVPILSPRDPRGRPDRGPGPAPAPARRDHPLRGGTLAAARRVQPDGRGPRLRERHRRVRRLRPGAVAGRRPRVVVGDLAIVDVDVVDLRALRIGARSRQSTGRLRTIIRAARPSAAA